jgi:hypothetical protein
LCDHFTRGVHAEFTVACEQRRLVPRPADFQRLFAIASFR